MQVTITKTHHDGVIFDRDGMVTKTAALKAAARKRLFDGCLEDRAVRSCVDRAGALRPFGAGSDDRLYVDGKPHHGGLRDVLAYQRGTSASSRASMPTVPNSACVDSGGAT